MADIGNLSGARESSYGQKDGNGVPTLLGLTFLAINNSRGDAPVSAGEPAQFQDDSARADFHEEPPDPGGVWVNGVQGEHFAGDIAFTMPLRGLGGGSTSITTNDDLPLFHMLAASMSSPDGGDPASNDATGAVNVNSHTVTGTGVIKAGQILAIEQDGVAEYVSVTGVAVAADDTITYSPALPTGLSGETVRALRMLYTRAGDAPGESLCFRYDSDGIRYAAHGCRWSEAKITIEGTRSAVAFTFRSPYIVRDNASGSAGDPERTTAPTYQFSHSRLVLSDESGSRANGDAAAPLAAGRKPQAVKADSLAITMTATLARKADTSHSPVGADLEVTDFKVSVEATLSQTTTDFDADVKGQVRRMLTVGLPPVGTGLGFAVVVPGAFLTGPATGRAKDEGRTVQPLSWAAGRYTSDDSSDDAGNSKFRIGMGA